MNPLPVLVAATANPYLRLSRAAPGWMSRLPELVAAAANTPASPRGR